MVALKEELGLSRIYQRVGQRAGGGTLVVWGSYDDAARSVSFRLIQSGISRSR
jgi:hypothetical protein